MGSRTIGSYISINISINLNNNKRARVKYTFGGIKLDIKKAWINIIDKYCYQYGRNQKMLFVMYIHNDYTSFNYDYIYCNEPSFLYNYIGKSDIFLNNIVFRIYKNDCGLFNMLIEISYDKKNDKLLISEL